MAWNHNPSAKLKMSALLMQILVKRCSQDRTWFQTMFDNIRGAIYQELRGNEFANVNNLEKKNFYNMKKNGWQHL